VCVSSKMKFCDCEVFIFCGLYRKVLRGIKVVSNKFFFWGTLLEVFKASEVASNHHYKWSFVIWSFSLARIGEALWFEGFLARIGDASWFLSRYSFEVYVLCVCTHLVLLFKLKFCALWFLCIVQYATGTRKFQPHHNLAFKENKKILVVFLYFALWS